MEVFQMFDLVSRISLNKCMGAPIVCEPCNVFGPEELLFLILHNHILYLYKNNKSDKTNRNISL